MDKQGPLNVTCRIHASHRCCFIVATGAVAYCDILHCMKDILRFYHNILLLYFLTTI